MDIVYNYLSGEKLPDYIITILSTLGIDERRLKRIDKVTQYNNVYIPDNGIILRHGVRYYTSEYKAIISSIVETCNRYHSIANKIYLTRSKIRDGKDYGEKEIESSFEQKGYLIMSPESLSFVEQVNTVNNCRDIVTTEGSVSHNALFCNPPLNRACLSPCIKIRAMRPLSRYRQAARSLHRLCFPRQFQPLPR